MCLFVAKGHRCSAAHPPFLPPASRSGAIPIVDDGGQLFEKYMPGIKKHVITTTTAWQKTLEGEDLAQHLARLLKDPEALERRRVALHDWYVGYTKGIEDRLKLEFDQAGHKQKQQ